MTLTTENLPRLPTGVYNLGGAFWQLTAWKRNCSIVSLFPSPAPRAGICPFCATPPESTAAGSTRWSISSGWDSVREREREEETFRTDPDTPEGCLRVKMGGDPRWQTATISHTQADVNQAGMNYYETLKTKTNLQPARWQKGAATKQGNVRRSQEDVGSTVKETNGGKDKRQIKRKLDVWCLEASFLEVQVGFSSETYRFQPLHCILADVHASGLLHLHMSQILQGRDRRRDRKREKVNNSVKILSCGYGFMKFK